MEKPTRHDGKPTDGRPTDGRPTDGRPTDGRPTDGRRGRRLLLASTALSAALLGAPAARAQPPGAAATPQGGQVVGGTAQIAQAPNSVTITQSSARTAIDWQSFNVGANATVTFKQPNAQAIALNRVIANDPSIIAGRIDANGQIVLINQSGVVFTPGSQVNAESLVVSTAGISPKNFMAGHMVFDQAPRPGARIVNDGTITMKQAGLAAFVAPQVVNRGVITATLGHVILAGVSTFTLDMSGDGLVSIDVTHAVRQVDLGGRRVTALVTNSGTIIAEGGAVTLTAQAVDGVIQQLLDVRGSVQADSVGAHRGAITIAGIGGDLQVAGSLLARGNGQPGGTIAVDATGAITIDRTARIDASGAAGGGVVALGTDAARALAGPADRAAPKARSLTIAKGAVIAADATQAGPGGDITLLSSRHTTQAGALSARGAGGKPGGRIETSSDGVISLSGTETVFSPHGIAGTILLDPATLVVGTNLSGAVAGTIVAGGTTTIGTDDNNTSYVDPAVLDALTGTIILTASSLLSVQSAIAMADTSPVTLSSGGAVMIDAAVGVGGALEIDAATSIVLAALVTAPTLDLAAQASIAEIPGGAIDVTSLHGQAGGSALFGEPGNRVATLAGFNAGQTFLLDDAGHPLTIAAALDAANATLSAAGIAIDAPIRLIGDLQGPGPLALASTNGVSQTGAATITAGEFTSDGGTIVGGVALDAATNVIDTIGPFGATGPLALNDTGTQLTIGGRVTASQATLVAARLFIGQPISVASVLALAGSAGINQLAAGTLTAATLTSAGSVIGGLDMALDAANTINTLGAFVTTDPFSLNDPGAPLTIAGPFAAPSASFSAPSLDFTGAVSISGALSLASAGISEAATAAIAATTLVSIGPIGGSAQFGGTNVIDTLAAFTATGNFLLDDGVPLRVTGPVQASSITLADPATLTLAGPLSAGAGTIDLVSGGIADQAATLLLPDGTLVLAPFDPAAPLDFGGAQAGAVQIAPGLASAIAASGAREIVLDGNGIAIDTPITVANTLALQSTGSITQTALITAPTLTGAANGSAALTLANPIGTLGSFSDPGGRFSLTDAGTLTVAGPVSGASIALVTGNLTIPGAINAGLLSLTTAGSVTETGAVAASTLAGNIAGSLALTGNNAILSLGSLTTGDATIDDGSTLAIDGPLTTPNATITAAAIGEAGPIVTGILSFSSTGTIAGSGPITATELTGNGGPVVSLGGANLIGTLGGFSDTGGFALNDTIPLLITGPITAPGILAFGDPGSITATGSIVAGTLASLGTLGGPVALDGGNIIQALGNFADATGFSFADQVGFAIAGLVSAPSLSLSTPGSITETGVLATARFDGSAAAMTLTGANQVVTLGAVSVPGALLFNDTTPLTITGPIAAATLALGDTGAITEPGSIVASTLASLGTIGGAVALTGQNSIASLGSFAGAQSVTLDDASSLTVAGPFTAATATLAAGAMSIPGSITAGSLSLASNGAIDATGPIAASLLQGTDAGALALTGANRIGTLGSFTVIGNAVIDDTTALSVAGPFTAPNATLIAAALTIPGTIATAGTLALGTGGTIGETGSISSGTLESDGTIGGAVALTGTNMIDALGNFTSRGSFDLADAGSLTVTGTVSAPEATLGAGGITNSGDIIAPATLSLASTGSITSTGTIDTALLTGHSTGATRLAGTTRLATLGSFTAGGRFGLTDADPLTVAGPLTAGDASLTAPGIAVPGLIVTSGTLAFGGGGISETGAIDAAVLQSSGALGGNAGFTGTNRIASLAGFDDTGHYLTLKDASTLALTGPVTARAVTITATGQLVLDGTAGGGLFIQGANLPTAITAGVKPRLGLDSVLQVNAGYAQQLVQTGVFDIDTGPVAQADGTASQSNTLFIMLPSSGSATFAGLQAPNTTLVLDLGGGRATGQLALHFLVVAGSTAGNADFTGSLGNVSGQAAAHNGLVVPVPGSNYRFNACIIGSVNCTLLPTLTLPEGNPLQAFDLSPTRRRRLDRNVRLPGVAAKDY